MCHGYTIVQFKPSLTSFVFSHNSLFINKSSVLFSNIKISVVSDSLIRLDPQVPECYWCQVRHLWCVAHQSMSTRADSMSSEDPPWSEDSWSPSGGRQSSELPGLSWAPLTGRKEVQFSLSECQLGVGHFLRTLRSSSLEGRQWEGRRTLAVGEPGPGENKTHLSVHLPVPIYQCVLRVQEFPWHQGMTGSPSPPESGVLHLDVGHSLGVFLRWALQQGDSETETDPPDAIWTSSAGFPHAGPSDTFKT
jgi:hypothetical protein